MSSSFMMGKGLRSALVMDRKLEMVEVERCEVHTPARVNCFIFFPAKNLENKPGPPLIIKFYCNFKLQFL